MTLLPGDVIWVDFGAGVGREQQGRRPAVIVASHEYVRIVDALLLVVPVSSRDRSWPNHVRLTGETGLSRECFAMTEQVKTISRDRLIGDVAGGVDRECLARIRVYAADYLGF